MTCRFEAHGSKVVRCIVSSTTFSWCRRDFLGSGLSRKIGSQNVQGLGFIASIDWTRKMFLCRAQWA